MFYKKISFLAAMLSIVSSLMPGLWWRDRVDPRLPAVSHPLSQSSGDRERVKSRSKLQILLPLYIYPNWYDRHKYIWSQVTTAAKKVPIVAIINPHNGPDGAPPNADYRRGIRDLQQAGVKIVGYVATNYGQRDLQAVKADIDLYAKHFQVEGIFLDETASERPKLNYYRQLYQYVKERHKLRQVIINPGTDVDESYVREPVADVAVIFENYHRHWMQYKPPSYIKKYAPQRFATLIHTSGNRLIKSSIDRALKHQFGYIYMTNDSTSSGDLNPWNSLPTYWTAQVNYIQKLNGRK